MIDTILQSRYFNDQPPVLVDIGASGEINAKWKSIAGYSFCLAFDADDREFHVSDQVNKSYKRLITFNRIVTTESSDYSTFYLTASPYCSSLLEPDMGKLRPWLFNPLFKVIKQTQLPTVTLAQSLQTAGIKYIDWFKVDTQGTDLRIFKSLPSEIQETVLAAEFEPGIMDAYKQEDKLYSVMEEMHKQNFWLSSMKIKGTQRLKSDYADQFGSFTSERIIRTSPGWAEINYFRNPAGQSCRSLLMTIVFALLERQYGFALEISDYGIDQFNEPLFTESRKYVLSKIKSEKIKLPLIILKRKVNKLFARIDA